MCINGYRSAIDAYFSAKLTGADEPVLPTQKVPPRLRELLDFLAKQTQFNRSRITSYLLDLAEDLRLSVSKWIDEELAEIPKRGRCLPCSTVGNVRMTIFVNIEGIVDLSHETATQHAQASMIASGESDRVLLELAYGPNGLAQASMSTVSLQGLSREHLEQLRKVATDLKEKCVANFGKVGRNERCPCGSGKKFKRCCIPSP